MSPRLRALWFQSHAEENIPRKHAPRPNEKPAPALLPRSFVDATARIGFGKDLDFNFRGAMSIDPETEQNRQWVLAFARRRFTRNSHFQITDSLTRERLQEAGAGYRKLGPWDYTLEQSGFVPKEHPEPMRKFFDEDYFRILCRSRFTLCPAGDAPWSMRFHEAILSKSIPIVESPRHTGRNQLEYDIGYRYVLASETTFRYQPEWAEENYRKLLKHQTLLSGISPVIDPAPAPELAPLPSPVR